MSLSLLGANKASSLLSGHNQRSFKEGPLQPSIRPQDHVPTRELWTSKLARSGLTTFRHQAYSRCSNSSRQHSVWLSPRPLGLASGSRPHLSPSLAVTQGKSVNGCVPAKGDDSNRWVLVDVWMLVKLLVPDTQYVLGTVLFYLITKYLLTYLSEGKGGRKKGRETSMCGCLQSGPYWGPGPQPRRVPRLGIEQATLWFTGPCSVH